MEKVRTAVIGIGNMGKHHARNYFEIKNSKLIAIADINKELGNEISKNYNCKFYESYNEMLDREDIQAVSVVVPSKYHHEVGMEVLGKGIHALIEKPISSTANEAHELIKCAKTNKAKLMIGHIERFNPGVIRLKEIINEGRLGEITSITSKRVGIFPPQIKDANVIIDLAVHDIDIINLLLEREPNAIDGNGGKAILDNREDYAEIFMKYGNISGFVQVNWITPIKIRNISVTGTKGYAELNYITQKLQLFYSNYSKVADNFGDFVIKFGEPEKQDIKIKQKEPLRAELESFINSVANNKPVHTPGEDGLKALNIALKSIEIINGRK
ncbi:oxidoreductase [bacterium (Candidatus Howlettbacteria) CG23_combo_of_CG06-09_8_20_14_all_37_9]|nr:MAG: oxidoreductase [bacterium (Candidatus Howlettbacteria) CG23_combo_of_CG06-09_8_20_14_all_37_9]